MSAGEDEWLDGMEEMLVDSENSDAWLHFISGEVPDYMYEHWQNMYEAESQDYFADVGSYAEVDGL